MVNLLNLLKEGKEEKTREELLEEFKQLNQEKNEVEKELRECREENLKSRIKDLVIRKYSSYINEKEIKTIEDLKNLIQPENQRVQEIILQFQAFNEEEKIQKAYDFVATHIKSIPSLGINFWMSIEEILENKVADYEDKAIFLCSLLEAMGIKSQIAIAELSDGSNKPFILIPKTEDKYLLLDPNTRHETTKYEGTLKELIEKYEEGNQKITRFLYKFDNQNYEELI